MLRRLGLHLGRYLFFWGAVWLLQWWLAPTWLVGSRTGLSTLLQALPGAVIALLALIFASFYILAQQAANVYGSRAVAVLLVDVQVLQLLSRALVLAVVPLLIGGQVPDRGNPSDAITSLVATITLAAAVLILSAANILMGLLGAYTAPRSFMLRTVEPVEQYLDEGELNFVVFRVTALGEMVRAAIRRGEGVAVMAGLEGLRTMQSAYIKVARQHPEIRVQQSDDPSGLREGWLGQDLADTLARAGEEALRSGAVEHDTDAIATTLEDATLDAVKAKQKHEARALVTALTRLGVSSHQIRPETINLWPQSAPALAHVEKEAEESLPDVAAEALAAWALVVAYPVYHFGHMHPSFELSGDELGDRPNWERARRVIESLDFQRSWANKIYGNTPHLLEALRLGASSRGIALRDWPKLPPPPPKASQEKSPS
jgi:hypothetical protein